MNSAEIISLRIKFKKKKTGIQLLTLEAQHKKQFCAKYLLHLSGWSCWKSFFGVARAINRSEAFAESAALDIGHIVSWFPHTSGLKHKLAIEWKLVKQ